MTVTLEDRVRRRAGDACEYCRVPQSAYRVSLQLDHIIARQHGGRTTLNNLALSCLRCNLNKGPNIAGIDPKSGALVPLFHPRRDHWDEHFRWNGSRLVGSTPIGRVTVRVLAVNHPDALALRRRLIAEGTSFGRRSPRDSE